jgi:hypothetical protein
MLKRRRQNVLVEWLKFLLLIREAQVQILVRRPTILNKVFVVFPQPTQANAGILP